MTARPLFSMNDHGDIWQEPEPTRAELENDWFVVREVSVDGCHRHEPLASFGDALRDAVGICTRGSDLLHHVEVLKASTGYKYRHVFRDKQGEVHVLLPREAR